MPLNGGGSAPSAPFENYMAALGERLIDNGYSILPIEPGTKNPGLFADGAWRGMPGWTKWCTRQTSLIEAGIFGRWPSCGVGLACGLIVGIDIDIVADPQLVVTIQQLAFEMLGPTPLQRIGLAPKRMLVYRAKEPFAGIKRHPIEVHCRGQQIVAYGIHPETGKPYRWIDESPESVHLTQLPAISAEQAREFLDAAYALIPAGLKPKDLVLNDDGRPHVSSGRQRGTPEAIASALSRLPNTDLDYDTWRNVGMATWAAIGPDGLGLFLAWSAKSPKHDVRVDSERFYRGLKKVHSLGAGTIYYMAEQHGWICPPEIRMDGAADFAPDMHPAQALIASAALVIGETPEAALAPVEVNVFVPDEFHTLDPDSFIGLFVEHCLASAPFPQPILAVAAALCCCAVLIGRHYRTPTNLRANIYLVSIAESGSGKEHPRTCISEVLAQSGLLHLLGGSKLVSGGGLLSALHRSPASLFQLDEFGQFLSHVTDKRASKHLAEVWDHLTELFTKAAVTYAGTEYTDQLERPRRDICQPLCVVHATTTPRRFWSAVGSASIDDGSLARWQPFPSDDPVPERNRRPRDITKIPPALIEATKAISKGAADWKCPLGEGPNIDPQPYVVPFSKAAEKLLDKLGDDLLDRRRRSIGSGRGAILARWWEYVVKLALIHAVSRNSTCPVVEEADASWAQAIVGWSVSVMLRDVERHVSDNDNEAEAKRILSRIRLSGLLGITATELTRNTQFVGARRRNEILSDLLAGEFISREDRVTGHRPATVYRIV